MLCRTTGESTSVWRQKGGQGGHRPQPLLGFQQERQGKQSKQFELASLRNSSGLWGMGVVLNYLYLVLDLG